MFAFGITGSFTFFDKSSIALELGGIAVAVQPVNDISISVNTQTLPIVIQVEEDVVTIISDEENIDLGVCDE